MKTTRIYAILSILLLFAAASTFAGNVGKDGQVPGAQVIRHSVKIHMTFTEISLCNNYLVEIHDQTGRLIAPAKRYDPSETTYLFYERGAGEGAVEGTRIAVLRVAMWPHHYVCEQELFTDPAVITGHFYAGSTYRYDLFPQYQASKE